MPACARPTLVRLPHIRVLIRCRIVRQAAVAGGDGLLDVSLQRARAAVDDLRLRVPGREDRKPLEPAQAETHRDGAPRFHHIEGRIGIDRLQEAAEREGRVDGRQLECRAVHIATADWPRGAIAVIPDDAETPIRQARNLGKVFGRRIVRACDAK